jgi:ABC-type multidrug transport system fused ATPase/permease subunit
MVVSPSFIAPAVFIIFLYVRLSLSYVRCSRDLRRLESNARSPIYSKFGETLTGIVTVRSFGAE